MDLIEMGKIKEPVWCLLKTEAVCSAKEQKSALCKEEQMSMNVCVLPLFCPLQLLVQCSGVTLPHPCSQALSICYPIYVQLSLY